MVADSQKILIKGLFGAMRNKASRQSFKPAKHKYNFESSVYNKKADMVSPCIYSPWFVQILACLEFNAKTQQFPDVMLNLLKTR